MHKALLCAFKFKNEFIKEVRNKSVLLQNIHSNVKLLHRRLPKERKEKKKNPSRILLTLTST